MSNFYNKVSQACNKPINKRTTLQEITQANQWINGENNCSAGVINNYIHYFCKSTCLCKNNFTKR